MSRILIIEDEEAIASLEKDYLELSGFEVDIETDGNKGLDKALSRDYDLFILDLMLPGMDGFDICREIRERLDTPILMVSARVSPLAMEVMDISETSMTLHPSLYAALSKESLVRVEGSKKRLAMIFPSRARFTFSPFA